MDSAVGRHQMCAPRGTSNTPRALTMGPTIRCQRSHKIPAIVYLESVIRRTSIRREGRWGLVRQIGRLGLCNTKRDIDGISATDDNQGVTTVLACIDNNDWTICCCFLEVIVQWMQKKPDSLRMWKMTSSCYMIS